ncbi:MAG: DUF1345 domain-containing protein [Polyangiaceae bacterium]
MFKRPRTLISVILGLLVAFVLPREFALSTRLLVAWDLAAVCWLGAVLWLMARSDTERIRKRAADEDDGALIILVASSLAAVASLAAIAFELSAVKQGASSPGLHLALALLTVFCSWLFVHLSFTLHYAHEYYGGGCSRNGLVFPGAKRNADYFDFAYFAVNIGAAGQTSDVQVTSPEIRRTVLAHTVLSFFFNTTVLALGINVAASAL